MILVDFFSVKEVKNVKIEMVHMAPSGAIKFPMVCYGKKQGTDDGLHGEVSSFLYVICSSLEKISLPLR